MKDNKFNLGPAYMRPGVVAVLFGDTVHMFTGLWTMMDRNGQL